MLYPLSSEWYIDPSTGFMGVGTTNPAARLDVFGTAEIRGDMRISGEVILNGNNSSGVRLTANTGSGRPALRMWEADGSRFFRLSGDELNGYDSDGVETFSLNRQTGDAVQPLGSNGFLKAAVTVAGDGTVIRSFNNIGSSLTVQRISPGVYNINFGIGADLSSRFFDLSMETISDRTFGTNLGVSFVDVIIYAEILDFDPVLQRVVRSTPTRTPNSRSSSTERSARQHRGPWVRPRASVFVHGVSSSGASQIRISPSRLCETMRRPGCRASPGSVAGVRPGRVSCCRRRARARSWFFFLEACPDACRSRGQQARTPSSPELDMRFLSLSPLALFALTAAAQDPAPRHIFSDFDGDGLADLYVVAPGRDDVLLRNAGDGSFADVTEVAGLASLRSAGVRPGDFDRDELADLLLLTQEGELRLYRGLAGGAFMEVAEAGFDLQGAADAEWVDYDRDGWVDLKVETLTGEPVLFHNDEGLLEKVELGLEMTAIPVAVAVPAAEPSSAEEPPPTSSGATTRGTTGRRPVHVDVSLPGREGDGRSALVAAEDHVPSTWSAASRTAPSRSAIRRVRAACGPRATRRWACCIRSARSGTSIRPPGSWASARRIPRCAWTSPGQPRSGTD